MSPRADKERAVFMKKWRVESVPGGVQVSSRQIYSAGMLVEEVVLEASPLALARAADRQVTYDYPAPRRRK
jgi:hypothetical protein